MVKRVVIRHRTGLSQIIGITGELPEDWEAPMEIPSHLGPCALVINKPTYLVYKEKSYETEPSDRLGTAGDDAAGVCPE